MPNYAKRLGYGGSASIDGVQVLMTSGSFSTEKSISYLEPYDIDPTIGASRSRVEHADGTDSHSVSLSFDVTTQFLAILTTTKLFSRGYEFDVGIHDGEDAEMMNNCVLTSLTLSGSAGGIITAIMSATSASPPSPSLLVPNAFIRDTNSPIGYWYSGNVDVRDWNLTYNQAASPVYTNENTILPRYIKVGLVDFSLDVTTYEAVQAHNVINIAASTFSLTGNSSSEGFSFNGQNELGNYNHTFQTSASIGFGIGGSDGTIIL